MSASQTHTHQVTPNVLDEFTAACSCGWSTFDSFTTRTAALGAVDRHIAGVTA
jgi:hypothetical protein